MEKSKIVLPGNFDAERIICRVSNVIGIHVSAFGKYMETFYGVLKELLPDGAELYSMVRPSGVAHDCYPFIHFFSPVADGDDRATYDVFHFGIGWESPIGIEDIFRIIAEYYRKTYSEHRLIINSASDEICRNPGYILPGYMFKLGGVSQPYPQFLLRVEHMTFDMGSLGGVSTIGFVWDHLIFPEKSDE